MKSIPLECNRYEFRYPHINTVLLVDVQGDAVTVHASRDSFSPERKASFIRELASEGFIPDEHRWYSSHSFQARHTGITWVVDLSWLRIDERALAQTRRSLMKFIVVGTALLAFMMALLFTDNLGNVRVRSSPVPQRTTREDHPSPNAAT
ncbi:MAG TPA: hypothetical protein VII09_09875 [Opitutaceae bacterium]